MNILLKKRSSHFPGDLYKGTFPFLGDILPISRRGGPFICQIGSRKNKDFLVEHVPLLLAGGWWLCKSQRTGGSVINTSHHIKQRLLPIV